MLGKSIRFNSLVLGIFALITATLLSFTYEGTKDRIAEAKREAAKRALLEIIPLTRHDNDILTDTVKVPEEYLSTLGIEDGEINLARSNNKITAIIIPTIAPDGYSGKIQMLVGMNIDGTVAGVRVISHNETPGLGDKIDLKKNDWILNFDGKSLINPKPELWKVKKDKGSFDQLTGATITPRAVITQVLKTLQYFKQDKARLLKADKLSNPEKDTIPTEAIIVL